MSTAERKLHLLQLILESEDNNFITKLTEVARLMIKQKHSDWADELPQNILDELILSIEESEKKTAGTDHNEMLAQAKKEFPNLKF